MTPKIERFLNDTQLPTPCIVVDLDKVAQNYLDMQAAFPTARIFYALKANPGRPILKRLADLGAGFDAASWEEIDMCLQAGATPDRISFGNTIKKASAIRRAREAGIDLFVFDSPEELEKIAANAPGARVFCRLVVATDGAIFPLARKFGTGTDMALDLMHRCKDLGVVPYGLSFHPGSQQTGPEAHEAAIGQVAMLFDALEHDGIELKMINLGGGFPSRYQDEVAAIETEVVLVSHRSRTDPLRWVYLDIGVYGGLNETMDENTRYLITTPHDGTPSGPVVIAGPTCDSFDTLYEKTNNRLPLALKAGDRVRFHNTGAYVTTYATIGFNGFAPLEEHYI